MWVAWYKHGRNVWPTLEDFPSFREFFDAYLSRPWPTIEHKIMADHRPCPCCAPSWAPVRASRRSNATTEEIWALVLDWDAVEDPGILLRTASAFTCLIHTSPTAYRARRRGEHLRLRGIFPFAAPIPPGRIKQVFTSYRDYFGTRADQVSKGASAQFFYGIYKDDGPPVCHEFAGRFLDPWKLPGADIVDRDALMGLGRRKGDPVLAGRFRSLAKGESYAKPQTEGDGRDDATFAMCSVIAEAFPSANPDQVADLFVPSLHLMALEHPEGAQTRERVLDKLVRLLGAQSKVDEQEEQLQEKFWEAHGHPGRVGTYLPSELETLGNPKANDWILQHEDGLYLRTPHGFEGPVNRASIRVHQSLSVVPGATIFKANGPLPLEILAQLHGRPAAQVVYSLRASKTSFDPTTQTLRFAPTPLRALEPARSGFVEEWFSIAFSPEDRERIDAWLSLLPDLTLPLSCLMLIGAPGAGKNLFGASCGRFWNTNKPASAKRVLSRFNSDVLTCPLVWADEELPKDSLGHAQYEEFKHLIGAQTFSIEQKGRESTSVEGYLRFLVTANTDLFTSAYSHTSEGNSALARRILRIEIRQESAAFLEKHQEYTHGEYMREDVFCRHVLSLPKHKRVGRFGIANPPTFEHAIATRSVWGSRICQLMLTWLESPTKTAALKIKDGALWANASFMLKDWRDLSKGKSNVIYLEAPKDVSQLRECLASLCMPVRHNGVEGRKKIDGVQYREVDTDKLLHWAEENGWSNTGAVLVALGFCAYPQPEEENAR